MKKILFYPGTFNPPHFGHVSAVMTALRQLSFDEVWIMPSGKRVDKEIVTPLKDRKNMSIILVEYLQSMTDTPITLITDAVEERNTKYTHELIVELKTQSSCEIYQLVGIDGYLGIKERVIGPDEKFIVVKREGYAFPESVQPNDNLIILDEHISGISSTAIREMVKTGTDTYKKMVPEKIAAYIEEHELYVIRSL
jgi:nicotinate-nucleotide adenylyltransferase